MSFCAPTPITAPTVGAPVATPPAGGEPLAAPGTFPTVAPAVPPIPCQPELGEG